MPIVIASNAPVYTRRSLLVADGPQAPSASVQLRPMHKPPLASAGIYWAGKDSPGGAAPGGRTAAVGSTTTSYRLVVSKCAFGTSIRKERPGFLNAPVSDLLLLVDHHLSGLCHSATNEPSANVYLGGEITLYTIHPRKSAA